MLVTALSYSQSVRKIGNDTVVVMSVKDAEKVNIAFAKLNDSISLYRKTLDELEKEFSAYTGSCLDKVGKHLAYSKQLEEQLREERNKNKNYSDRLKDSQRTITKVAGLTVVTFLGFWLYASYGR